MTQKPRASSSQAQQEIDRAEKQFDDFQQSIHDLSLDKMNEAPKEEKEPQTKLAQKDIENSKEIYLKPKRTYSIPVNHKTGEREKFNEKFREEYNFQREYVHFIAEHNEIRGESIELTIKKFPGTPAEDWVIPVGKPVWAPRMVAERIASSTYHRLTMVDQPTDSTGGMTFYGTMISKNTINRLAANPVSSRKSIFMGAASF